MPETFRDAVCATLRCPPEKYGERVFWLCLHRHAVPLAGGLRAVKPELFNPDFELIEQVGAAKSLAELCDEVNQHHYHHQQSYSYLRGALRLRISGGRLIRLGAKLLA